MRRASTLTAGPRSATSTRGTAYGHLNDLLRTWARRNGASWHPPEKDGGRYFGACEGTRDGVRFEVRGCAARTRASGGPTAGVPVRLVTEVRAWVPGNGASLRSLSRTPCGGPFEPDRIADLYQGDLQRLTPTAVDVLLVVAPYSTILRLDGADGYHRPAPGGLVYVSPHDPRLHPGRIEGAGIDLLVGGTTRVARALAA